MRRAAVLISLVAVLVTALLASSSASAAEPGFNLPTKRLEGAYKFALQDRRFDPAGCYAPPSELAGILTKATGLTVGVARGTGSLRVRNRVYVLKSGTQLQPAADGSAGRRRHLRARLQPRNRPHPGPQGSGDAGRARPLSNFSLATDTFRLNKPDTAPRLEVLCPRGRSPIGGGMTQSPAWEPTARGSTRTPTSGSARSSATTSASSCLTRARRRPPRATVTMQTVCGRGVIPATPTPHKTVWVRSGQTKTVTARCPEGSVPGLRRLPAHKLPQRWRRLRHRVEGSRARRPGTSAAPLTAPPARASSPRSPTAPG